MDKLKEKLKRIGDKGDPDTDPEADADADRDGSDDTK